MHVDFTTRISLCIFFFFLLRKCAKLMNRQQITIIVLISEETQDARWAEYFSEILNRSPPETEPDIPVAVEDLEIETSPPSKEEISNAIKALKNNKAPGPDNLNAELFSFQNRPSYRRRDSSPPHDESLGRQKDTR